MTATAAGKGGMPKIREIFGRFKARFKKKICEFFAAFLLKGLKRRIKKVLSETGKFD